MPQIFRRIWYCLTTKCRNCGLEATDPELRAISPLDSTDHAGNLKSWTPHRSQTDSWHVEVRAAMQKNESVGHSCPKSQSFLSHFFDSFKIERDLYSPSLQKALDERLREIEKARQKREPAKATAA